LEDLWPYAIPDDLHLPRNFDWPWPENYEETRGFGVTQRFYSWADMIDRRSQEERRWPGIHLPHTYILGVFSSGIPCRCLARTGSFGERGWTFVEWDDPPFATNLGVSVSEGLPILPLWPGFAINTLFYAAILWLLFLAPFRIRRAVRIRRGRCPKCAYPVGVSPVCTECGRELREDKRRDGESQRRRSKATRGKRMRPAQAEKSPARYTP